jgi:hypothetical protein
MLIKYYVNIFVEGVGEKRKFSKYCSLRWKSLTPTIYRWAVWVVYLRLITTKSSHMDIMIPHLYSNEGGAGVSRSYAWVPS